ncbi:MAG: hypothetical protein ACXVFE_03575 [Gaiellaceae bacterium]
MTPAQYEDERLRLRAERISANFNRRMAELEANRKRGGLTNGLADGWSDADWLHPKVRSVLLRKSRGQRSLGRAYQTRLNGTPIAVLSSGRIVIFDQGVK